MKNILTYITFLLSILCFSQRPPVGSINPVYHDTQGKLDISSNGQASYTIPIAVPPSIQSVGPTINLSYSSGQMGGIAGQGWNINSISTISRVATRMDIDGYVDGVDFDNDDKLALDGQRLILVSGNYWADGSIYKTEVLSNSKIQLFGTGSNIYFIVTAPDGSRSWYGNFNGMNATDLTAFYIVRFEDTNGNFITYNYVKPYNKALCISEINFSANINGLNSPLNKIRFNYDYAKRGENAYIKGVKHEKIELLKSVFVYTGNLIFRKYVITHDLDTSLSYERVINVQEFNSNNEGANPIIFEYSNTIMDIANSEKITTYNNNLEFEDIRVSGDFDGDGTLDFMANNSLYTKLFQNIAGGTVYSSNEIFNRAFATNLIFNGKVDQFNSIANPLLENDNLKLRFFSLINN